MTTGYLPLSGASEPFSFQQHSAETERKKFGKNQRELIGNVCWLSEAKLLDLSYAITHLVGD